MWQALNVCIIINRGTRPFCVWAQPTTSNQALRGISVIGRIKKNDIVRPARIDFGTAVTLRDATLGWHNRRHTLAAN